MERVEKEFGSRIKELGTDKEEPGGEEEMVKTIGCKARRGPLVDQLYLFFKRLMKFGSIIKVQRGLEEAVGVAAVQVGIIVILKIIMRRRHLQGAVAVVELGTDPGVKVVVLKQERRNRVSMVITGVAQEVTVQPQDLHQVDLVEVQGNMDKQHPHNQETGVMVEISIPIQEVLVGRMGSSGKAIGTVGTSIKDYSLDLI